MQTNDQKLESVTETVIAIPFGGSDDESDFEDEDGGDEEEPGYSFPCRMYTHPELANRDLPDGPRLRMKAYHVAFGRCRDRMQEVLREIYAPAIKRVIDVIQNAYKPTEEDRLLPYTELRAVAISGTDRSSTSAVLDEIHCILLKPLAIGRQATRMNREIGLKTPVIVSTLAPTDCSSLASTMKTMISGFLESKTTVKGDDNDDVNRALASYDINLLECWYNKLRDSKDEGDLPKLVILITDVEKIEPAVMQDLFYICSLHVSRLPFVFILGLCTSPTPSYMHSAFPRKTLALLQLTRIEVTGGEDVLAHVLRDTFLNAKFEPSIMPSPAVLSFIAEEYLRTAQSIEFVMSLLQLVHLRHFTDPISIFAHDELLDTTSIEQAAKKLSEPSGRPFLHALLARLYNPKKTANASASFANGVNGSESPPETSTRKHSSRGKRKGKASANGSKHELTLALDALKHVRDIRQRHKERFRKARLAFGVVSEVRTPLVETGEVRARKEDPGYNASVVGTEIDLMCAWLRGTVADKEGKAFAKGVRGGPLRRMIDGLYSHLAGLPSEVEEAEKSTFSQVETWRYKVDALDLSPGSDERIDGNCDIKDEMSKWLAEFITDNTYDFSETELWDVWYTGNPTGLAEIFNPAPRAVIINALVHPERYLGNKDTSIAASPAKEKGKSHAGNATDGADAEDLIPDTALLFKGYLESGRMLNVYDWYMSFKESLDSRRRSEPQAMERGSRRNIRTKKDREKAVKRLGPTNGPAPPSPTKGRGRGRGTTVRGRGSRGGKSKGSPDADPDSDAGGDENDENDLSPEERERWESEVQARFIHSVQELDLLGFIKHTGRKADHVLKTVYELPDYT